jgi:hypothetical protein
MHDHHGPAKAVHNMCLVGEHGIFLSHLPMFMPPHDAQVILEATFLSNGKTVDSAYAADRASHRNLRFYTVQPEEFVLQELFQADPTHGLRTQFKATVFRGHLEKGGTPVEALQNIDVHVKRLVHAHTFSGDRLAPLTYLLFGAGTELLLAHCISGAPDFDQIVSVTVKGPLPAADELQRGVTIEVPARSNEPAHRLQSKDTAAVRGHVTGAHQFLDLTITVQSELYFEEGELSSTKMSAAMFDQTREEKKAGFV